jgi:hypothetical protein
MVLGPVLCTEPDQDHPALPVFGRDHPCFLGQSLFPDQPGALKQVAVGVADDDLVAFVVFAGGDLEDRAAAQLERQPLPRHPVSQRVGMVEFHLERGPRAPELLAVKWSHPLFLNAAQQPHTIKKLPVNQPSLWRLSCYSITSGPSRTN